MEAKEKREANVSRRREGSTISDAAERKCETPFPPQPKTCHSYHQLEYHINKHGWKCLCMPNGDGDPYLKEENIGVSRTIIT